MGIEAFKGTPIVGSVSLTNGAPAADIPIYIWGRDNATAHSMAAGEVLVISEIAVSSNDTANPKVTITDGSPNNPTTLYSAYAGVALPPPPVSVPVGILKGYSGKNLHASCASITSAKTVEIVIYGVIVKL